ncbi:lactate permease [Umbelopsis sp. AD052]|nr:lactate permease [Umbelopsis sp. AD052]
MVNIPVAPANATTAGLFVQQLAPIGGSLVGSFFVGLIPLIVVLVMLGVFRIPAHYSSLAGLIVCIFIAIFGWHMPAQQCFESIANGIVYANWPIMWIVVNAMFIYNIAVRSGKFELFRRWMISNTPPDKRILLLIIGYSFGALLEGVAGFGTPGAICSSLLVSLGFDPIDALTYTLIFDTTPVAFGALGIPVTTLATLTGLSAKSLSQMIGRQLPVISLFLPCYALLFYAGWRDGLLACWPAGAVAGISFAVTQAIFSNLVGPELPDLIAGLVSLISIIAFVQWWKPPYNEKYVATMATSSDDANATEMEGRQVAPANTAVEKPTLYEALFAWLPWLLIVIVVIIWTFLKVSAIGQVNVHWPHLDNQVWLTLYEKKYAAVWSFQPLATGTAILVAGIVFLICVLLTGEHISIAWLSIADTAKQLLYPVITVSFIMAFAYLYNYSGIAYTVGLTLSSVGRAFPFLSVWLGWLACFLSGSDTSANSLFGNLQVVAARQIGLSPILMAAANSSGAVTSKMISPQNLTTGVATIGLRGKEGLVLRRTILHSIIMCLALGVITCIEQYGIPQLIPAE